MVMLVRELNLTTVFKVDCSLAMIANNLVLCGDIASGAKLEDYNSSVFPLDSAVEGLWIALECAAVTDRRQADNYSARLSEMERESAPN